MSKTTKSKEKIYTVKDMLNYASIKYSLKSGFNNNFNSYKSAYETRIRECLKKTGFVEQDKDTGKFIYELPESRAKYFIDNIMKEYFEKRADKNSLIESFAKQDEQLNEQNIKALGECQPYDEFYDYDNLPPTEEEINRAIHSFMIEAIFAEFFDFDKEQYIADFIARKKCIDEEDVVYPFQKGYSYYNDKLNNPIKHYCTRKKSK